MYLFASLWYITSLCQKNVHKVTYYIHNDFYSYNTKKVYKIFIKEQMVIPRNTSLIPTIPRSHKLHNCVVFDTDNWHCDNGEDTSYYSVRDGEYVM